MLTYRLRTRLSIKLGINHVVVAVMHYPSRRCIKDSAVDCPLGT